MPINSYGSLTLSVCDTRAAIDLIEQIFPQITVSIGLNVECLAAILLIVAKNGTHSQKVERSI